MRKIIQQKKCNENINLNSEPVNLENCSIPPDPDGDVIVTPERSDLNTSNLSTFSDSIEIHDLEFFSDSEFSSNSEVSSDFQFPSELQLGSGSESESGPSTHKNKFLQRFSNWVVDFRVSKRAVNSLLRILNETTTFKENKYLPNDSRTLLKTPRKNDNEQMGEGYFKYFGLENQILLYFKKFDISTQITNILDVEINTDGININDNRKCFWPILINFKNNINILQEPLLIACYEGNSKPESSNDFLSQFVREFKKLKEDGFIYKNKKFFLNAYSINCDSPARAFITCSRGHNFTYGCHRCLVKGAKINNKMAFTSTTNLTPRVNFSDKNFFKNKSILEDIGINILHDAVLDGMHLVYLGVVKKFLLFFISGKFKLHLQNLEIVENRLSVVRAVTLNEFTRKISSFKFVSNWKAVELRQFLLYVGPYILKDILRPALYANFLTLHTAIRILESPNYCQQVRYNKYAHQLLINFVKNFKQIFGPEFCCYNVHNLIHLAAECMRFGTLTSFSCFKFENKLGKIRRLIKPSGHTLSQLNNRLHEWHACSIPTENHQNYPSLKSPINTSINLNDFIFISSNDFSCFKSVITKDFCVIINNRDNYFKMKNKKIVKIEHIFASKNNEIFLLGKLFVRYRPFYSAPVNSLDFFNITIASQYDKLELINLSELESKCYSLPLDNNEFAIIPLI